MYQRSLGTTKKIGRIVSQKTAEIEALIEAARNIKERERQMQAARGEEEAPSTPFERADYWKAKFKKASEEVRNLKAALEAARNTKLQNFSTQSIESELKRRLKKMEQQQEAARKDTERAWGAGA